MSDAPNEIIQARRQLLGEMISHAEERLREVHKVKPLTSHDLICIWLAITNNYTHLLVSQAGERALKVLSVEVLDNQIEMNKLDSKNGILKQHLRLEK